MKRPSQPLIVGVFVLLCLIWGTTWAAIQIGLEGIPPFTGAAMRFGLASLLLLVLALSLGVRLGRNRREKLLWLVNGMFSFTISYGVVYWSEQWVPSGLASVLFATYPLFVAVISHFALPSEALTRREVLGILLGFAGVAVIFTEDFSLLGGPQVTIAAVVMLLSPVAAAVGSVSVKRWGAGVHPFSLTAIPMAMAAAILGAMGLAFESEREVVFDTVSLGALLYLAVVGSALTFSLYYWLLAYLPVKRLALIAYLIPVVAVLLGVLRGEPLTNQILAGSGVVVVGVALAVQSSSPDARSG